MRRGRSYWKMNTALLHDEIFQEQLRQRWAEWSKQIKNEDLASAATRGDHDGRMAEVLETAGDAR